MRPLLPAVEAYAADSARPRGISRADVAAFAEAWARSHHRLPLREFLGWDPAPTTDSRPRVAVLPTQGRYVA